MSSIGSTGPKHSARSAPPADLLAVATLAHEAGALLRRYFSVDAATLGIEFKADESPVSRADFESDALLREGLHRLFPGTPVISEEAAMPSFAERGCWPSFHLVDPLDGTKEFLRGSPDFTVNVARIESGVPVWGVILVPMENLLVVGMAGKGAWVSRAMGQFEPMLPPTPDPLRLRAVLSQSHRAESELPLLERFGLHSLKRRGSSLKFLLVALGEADVYFRRTPTWEWDTAAGQAIIESVGGVVCDSRSGAPLRYNRENPLNGPFLACMASLKETCLERHARAAM